jgi:hypothetical protein
MPRPRLQHHRSGSGALPAAPFGRGPASAAIAAKDATATIPMSSASVTTRSRLGFAASLARPSGNATGVNFFVQEYGLRYFGPAAARCARDRLRCIPLKSKRTACGIRVPPCSGLSRPAWKHRACGRGRVTADLDSPCARRPPTRVGRGEETRFQVERRNWYEGSEGSGECVKISA